MSAILQIMRFLALLILFYSCQTPAQDLISNDSVLSEISKQLPQEWTLTMHEDHISITYSDAVWIHFFNSRNASVIDPGWARDEAYVKQYGRKIVPMITYAVRDWNDSIKTAAKRHNEDIQRQQQALIIKYDLEDVVLSGRHIGRYRDDPTRDLSEDEMERVSKYVNERDALAAEKIEFPEYSTEHYALLRPQMNYSKENSEFAYMLEQIYPAKATADIEKMEAVLKKLIRSLSCWE